MEQYKNNYSKRQYRELLESYGWNKGSSEEKHAIKLARFEILLIAIWRRTPIRERYVQYH